MLLQKIKEWFAKFNYFLKRVFIPKVLNFLMVTSLTLVYLLALGTTSLFMRLIKPSLFSSKRNPWQDTEDFDLTLENARRQS